MRIGDMGRRKGKYIKHTRLESADLTESSRGSRRTGKLNDEAKIQCPFYLSKKREKLRQAITITCENIENNLGFDVKNMLSFKSIRERTDWMGLFCEDGYQNCPYYKKIYQKYEEAEAWESSRNRKKKSKEKKCR